MFSHHKHDKIWTGKLSHYITNVWGYHTNQINISDQSVLIKFRLAFPDYL